MFDDLHNGILPILPSREFITLVFDQIQQINNRKSAQRCIICYLPRRQGRQQWLLKSNSSNTWFDTIFLVSEIHNECHTCLYYLGTWLWSEACYVLMISFRNCEIWQSVKMAPFKLLTSGNCHNFTFLNSLFVVFLVPWNLKKVVCLPTCRSRSWQVSDEAKLKVVFVISDDFPGHSPTPTWTLPHLA